MSPLTDEIPLTPPQESEEQRQSQIAEARELIEIIRRMEKHRRLWCRGIDPDSVDNGDQS